MNARILVISLCLLFYIPVNAYGSSRYLELSNVKDDLDEYGLVVFSGEVHNTHPTQPMDYLRVYIALKKDGSIIDLLKISFNGMLRPLGTVSFTQETIYTKEEYDEFSTSARGRLEIPDEDLVVGEVYIDEESFNIVYGMTHSYGFTGDVIFGEIHNNTNAVISKLVLTITFFDARGDRLARVGSGHDRLGIHHDRIEPGEIYNFDLWYESLPKADKIKSRILHISWGILEIVDNPIATTVDGASWGQIKAMGR